MAISEDERKWWGWGREGAPTPEAEGLFAFLAERLQGLPEDGLPLPELDALDVRDPVLPPDLVRDLTEAAGPENVRTDRRTRVFHAMGRSYRDLIRVRLGDIPAPPDAVVYPGDHAAVVRVLEAAARHGAAATPFGGGSGVVGGVELDPGIRPNICLDVTRLNQVLSIDRTSLTARVQAGMFGPDLEAALNREGFTLGHFPQSFEYSTLGGWIAARGAGHKSIRYGKMEDLVVSLRAAIPGGELTTPRVPAAAAGGDLTALLIGSEGTLGVITEAEVKIRPRPEAVWFDTFVFPTFQSGLAAVRTIMAEGLRPATLRLSDAMETAALTAEARARRRSHMGRILLDRLLPMYLGWRGIDPDKACLLLASGEGGRFEIRPEHRRIRRICRRHGAVSGGTGPARTWEATRYTSPYLRDEMITRRIFVETLETAATWDRLAAVCDRVKEALERGMAESGAPGLVMAHLSHAYPQGANLYFTFMAPQARGRELDQWTRTKEAAIEAVLETGAALSHHHGIGRDHKAWLGQYWGRGLLDAARAAKASLDPLGLLNPGALFDPNWADRPPVDDQPRFSFQTRRSYLDQMEGGDFDVLVIGGGIVGAGVAWDASLRGLRTALVEKSDFGSGTSGKSSRMVHGGLRYLKMLDIKLVRESLLERHHLMNLAPHLVRPGRFLIPVFKGFGDSRTVLNLGLWGYDTLAGSKGLPGHENLTAQEALRLEPLLAQEALDGALTYFDGLTDDARLTLETVKAAARAGAATANYVEMVSLKMTPDRITARLLDRLTGREFSVRARTAVNAAGVWSDRVRSAADGQARGMIRPAKGIHIVFPRRLKPITHILVLRGSDGRPIFTVPVGEVVYAGTTDTDYQGDLDQVHAEAEEVAYLLEAVNRSIAGAPLTPDDVCASWAGLRPLVSTGKGGETKDISREHEIRVEHNRLVTVCGGKLTTFRLMSAQTVDRVATLLDRQDLPLESLTETQALEARRSSAELRRDLPARVRDRLAAKYGPSAGFIADATRAPLLGVVLDESLGLTVAEVHWAVSAEMALTLNDAMVRRLGLTYLTEDAGLSAAPKVAAVMAGLLDWTPGETADQLERYRDLVRRETGFRRVRST